MVATEQVCLKIHLALLALKIKFIHLKLEENTKMAISAFRLGYRMAPAEARAACSHLCDTQTPHLQEPKFSICKPPMSHL